MSSVNTLTGRNGKFSAAGHLIARTKKWDVSSSLASKSEWGDSDSAGYTNRAAGRRDGTFSTEGVYDTSAKVINIFAPGDSPHATLWQDGVTANALFYWDFPRALNSDFKLSVNIDTEEVEGWSADWGADGIFYPPGAAGAPTLTLPAL